MNKNIITIIVTAALATFASAEKVTAAVGASGAVAAGQSSVKISNVHLCCQGCVKGAEKAVAKAKGVTAAVDKDAGTVTLTGDKAAVQSGVDALVAAGYYGKSDSADVSVKDTSGAKDGKVSTLTVNDVHLCCDKCATAAKKALAKVKGVTSDTAEKKATSFEVKGDFSPKEVFTALQAAGFTGKAGK